MSTNLSSVWVHGTAFQAQDPQPSDQRLGWGTIFRGSGSLAWFHVSIPIPTIGVDHPLLEKIFFLYEIQAATIRNVDVYDGRKRILAMSGLFLQGDPGNNGDSTRIVDGHNSISIAPAHTIYYGLGISIGVQFGTETGGPYGSTASYVLFASAGAAFRPAIENVKDTFDPHQVVKVGP